MQHAVRTDSEPRAIVARARIVVLCLVALMPFAYALGVVNGRHDGPTVRQFEAGLRAAPSACLRDAQ